MFTLNNTPEALHSWVLYKSFGSFFCFVCVFTFSCKQLCEKCLQRVLKSEMCIRYAAWALWPIFTFSLCFTLFMCHFARLRMPGYEETRWWEVRHELSGADRLESIYQIVECSFNVLRRRWRSPTCPFSSRCWLVAAGGDDVLRTGASKIIGVFCLFFYCLWFLGHREHHRISHFAPFAFLFLDHMNRHFLALLFCTGNKHVEHIFDMICLGQNRAFLHRRFRFSGYLVYLQMLPFCILQRVSKHCVAMLILLNLHWQAALMVFFMCLFGYSLCLWPLTVLDDKQLVVTM